MSRSHDDAPILVTGGAGFIGSHLTRRLRSEGHAVRVLDDLTTGHRDRVPADVPLVEASILDPDALAEAADECRIVFHLAAMVSVAESVAHPDRCHAVNVEGTLRTLEAARHAGVRRLVFASSCAVYGNEPRLPSRTSDPVAPASPYAASKAGGEAFVAAYGRCTPLETVSLRFFNVYGPGQDPNSPYAAVIAAFTDRLRRGDAPRIFGDGSQTRDFVAVTDIVEALCRASRQTDLPSGSVFNAGTGVRTNLLELLEQLGTALDVEPRPQFEAARTGDVQHSVAEVEETAAALSFRAGTDLATGLRELVSAPA